MVLLTTFNWLNISTCTLADSSSQPQFILYQKTKICKTLLFASDIDRNCKLFPSSCFLVAVFLVLCVCFFFHIHMCKFPLIVYNFSLSVSDLFVFNFSWNFFFSTIFFCHCFCCFLFTLNNLRNRSFKNRLLSFFLLWEILISYSIGAARKAYKLSVGKAIKSVVIALYHLRPMISWSEWYKKAITMSGRMLNVLRCLNWVGKKKWFTCVCVRLYIRTL